MRLLKPLLEWSGDQAAGPVPQKAKKDTRFHGRSKILGPVTLAWTQADGSTRSVNGRGINMSGAGICVEMSLQVAPGSRVYVQVKPLKLMGSGVVRHCVRHGRKYRLGLEFPIPLTSSF